MKKGMTLSLSGNLLHELRGGKVNINECTLYCAKHDREVFIMIKKSMKLIIYAFF